MKIKFLVDYRGRETGENFYQKGEVADLEPEGATFLIQDHRAVAVKAPKPARETKPVAEQATLPNTQPEGGDTHGEDGGSETGEQDASGEQDATDGEDDGSETGDHE